MVVALAAAAVGPAGCGTQDAPAPARTVTAAQRPEPAEDLGPAIDPGDARWSLRLGDDDAILALAARSGRRADHRVPMRLLQGRHDAGLVRAAIAEIWTDVDPGGDSLRTLDAEQRAVYALAWAGVDLDYGGFFQLAGDNAAAPLLRDLHATAVRVGAPAPLAGLIALAQRVRSKPRTRDDWARFDARYATLQRHRDTSLAHVLAQYIARHRSAFATP
ncbi:hypothetical protein [Conexibacter woesei]|uniref:hypothetical protein n=1 Tax=Conexibacter woesei TaxID=191495 RepID=UPI000401BA34|nr:hypothetical protein [Conexibacter woesei]